MWLYDPCKNILKEMSLGEIGAMCGITESSVSRMAQRGNKLKQIKCYVFKEKPTLPERRKLYSAETFQGEVWKRFRDTDHFVSNFGRVKRVYKTTTAFVLPYGSKMPTKKKYAHVKLKLADGIFKEMRLRNVVAEVFLKSDPNKTCLVHKNGDYWDCSVWNLKWVNRSELARKTGGKSRSKAVVLVDENTLEVINWWSSAREAARDENIFISHQAVTDRCNGKVKSRHEGYFLWESVYDQIVEGHEVQLNKEDTA